MADDQLFDDIVERELFIELVADGCTEINAGLEVGWTPARTRRNLADPDFAALVDAARDRADGTIERALFHLAKGRNLGAIQMWLYNRSPERWRDVKRLEVKNETNVNVALVAATKEAILATLRDHGPAALQQNPQALTIGLDDDVIEGEIVDE